MTSRLRGPTSLPFLPLSLSLLAISGGTALQSLHIFIIFWCSMCVCAVLEDKSPSGAHFSPFSSSVSFSLGNIRRDCSKKSPYFYYFLVFNVCLCSYRGPHFSPFSSSVSFSLGHIRRGCSTKSPYFYYFLVFNECLCSFRGQVAFGGRSCQ